MPSPERDLTAVEGSDQHYMLGQLAHGSMKSGDLAALLEKTINTTEHHLRIMRRFGHVERGKDGFWSLAKPGSAPSPCPDRKLPRRHRVDLSTDETSLEWYALQQLAHGPLRSSDLAELTDTNHTTVEAIMDGLRHHGHVRRLRNKKWELSPK